MKLQALLLGVWLLSATRLSAQTPVLVKDIDTRSGYGGSPSNFVRLNNLLLFSASNEANGSELWRTDGTVNGTQLIKDIWPGTSGSSISRPVAYKNYVYFVANDGVNGEELWRTNGITNETSLFYETLKGSTSSIPSGAGFTIFNNELYFVALVAANQFGLYKTDGTTTSLIKGDFLNVLSSLTVVNNQLYFNGITAQAGGELWKSDGTTAGTTLVRDLTSGTRGSSIQFIAAVGNKAVFNDDTRLYTSDGTSAGTIMLTDSIKLSITYTRPTVINNTLFFYAKQGIWRTDGISSGSTSEFVKLPQGSTINYYGLYGIGGNLIYLYKQSDTDYMRGINGQTGQPTAVTGASIGRIGVYHEGRYLYYLTGNGSSYSLSYTDGQKNTSLFNAGPGIGEAIEYNDELYFNGFFGQAGTELYKTSVPTLAPECVGFGATAAASATELPCSGGTVRLTSTVTGGTAPYAYQWQAGDVSVSTAASFSATAPGSYSLRVTDAKGCIVNIQPVSITSAQPTVRIGGSATICAGQSTTLTSSVSGGSSPYTYQWQLSNGSIAGATLSAFTATNAGTYSVAVVDAKGCSSRADNFVLVQNAVPTAMISPTGTAPVLSGSAVVLSVPAVVGQTYQWYRGGQAIAGATDNTYSTGQQGDYTVTVTRNGCSASSVATTISPLLSTEPAPVSWKLDVSPNPANDRIQVTLRSHLKAAILRLIDSGGRIQKAWTMEATGNQTYQLYVGNLPSGVYILQADVDHQLMSTKVIKQ